MTTDQHLAQLSARYHWNLLVTPCNLSAPDAGAYDVIYGGRRQHTGNLQTAVRFALITYESHRARYYRHGQGDHDRHPPLLHDEHGPRVLPRWPRINPDWTTNPGAR